MMVAVQEDGTVSSSSVTSSASPLNSFSLISLSPTANLTAAAAANTTTSPYTPPTPTQPPVVLRELKSDERGLYLIHLLINCAGHVAASSLDHANAFLDHISLLASPDGDTMQRIASYFTDALARRLLRSSWPGLYRALTSTALVPQPALESAQARKHFADLCPFVRLSFLVSNQAIMEAMEGEKIVHIIDLSADDPAQWVALLQAMNARPEGPPHLRITGVNEHREILNHIGAVLSEEAEKLDVPFQFNPIVSRLDSLDIESLRVKTGEALAISSVLKLHSLLAWDYQNGFVLGTDHSVRMENFLACLWGLSPKVMLVTEQESNHNGASMKERFMEALNFYAALFDCLESTVARQSIERVRVEKMMFGEEIRNIIACDGVERRERHEKLERWVQRMEIAGFARVPLGYYGLLQARRMLQGFGCEAYQVKEDNGCFFLCWQDRPLFSVSAWRCRRFN